MNLFELYFSARKRHVKWKDDRERRMGAIKLVFTQNAYMELMEAIQGVQDNLTDHLDGHHAPVKPKKEPAPGPVEHALEEREQTYEDLEKMLEV